MEPIININGREIKAVIDTGSTVSLIDRKLVEEYNLKVRENSSIKVRLLNNSREELSETVRVDVCFGDKIYVHKFYVYENFKFGILLGIDFCRASNAHLYFNSGTQEDSITDLFNEEKNSEVRIKKETEIKARSLTKIECYGDSETKISYFKPDKRISEEFQLVMHETLVDNSDMTLYVFNPNHYDLVLFENMKIGTITAISDIYVDHQTFIVHKSTIGTEKEFKIISGTEEEKRIIWELLESNRDLFGENVSHLGKAVGVEHKIDLKTDKPIKLRSYKHSPKEKEIIREQVNEMLKNGIIEESQSSYSFPVVLVKKKNGKLRFCIDYRKLNDITIKDSHPLPVIGDTIQTMTQCKFFSSLDLLSGYWAIYIREEDKHKTAFVTPDALYQFKVMPFGLTNAPATFQRYMQKVLNEYLHKFAVVYIDDVLVFSKTFEEHVNHLKLILEKIREHNLRFSIEKCQFLCREVLYLGHYVSENGIRPNDEKILAVKNFPVPKKVKDIQSFLGLANYYRNFVPRFAYIADPLTKLLRKNVKFEWNEECQMAFETMKTNLINAPIMATFKDDCECEVFTDACHYGYAAILGQIQEDKHVVISYDSKMFNKSQQQLYTVSEKECYAVVYALKKYRHYLIYKHFILYTDHNPLEYCLSFHNPNSRIARWGVFLQEYNYTIKYKPGSKHNNVDTLSRYPYEPPENEEFEPILFFNKTETEKPILAEELVMKKQSEDEWCSKIITALMSGNNFNSYKGFTLKDGILYKRWFDFDHRPHLLLCVPKELRILIVKELHDGEFSGGHAGGAKTYQKIKSRFYWENLEKSVKTYVRNCENCQLNKPSKRSPKGLMSTPNPLEPFECVGMDIVGPINSSKRGNKYIIVMVDLFTKWLETGALKNTKAPTLAKWFCTQVLPRHGAINRVITDNGSYFTSEFFEQVMELTSSRHITTAPYSPQSNGNAEKACGIISQMIKQFVREEVDRWDHYLPWLTFVYNTNVQKSTKYSPFRLLYNREAKFPIDVALGLPRENKFGENYEKCLTETLEFVRLHIKDAHNENKSKYDSKHRDEEFEVGDLVVLCTPLREVGVSTRFLPQADGPFRIFKKYSPLVYKLQLIRDKRYKVIAHIRRLKKWYSDAIPELESGNGKSSFDEEETKS